jgi:hypothetical protein
MTTEKEKNRLPARQSLNLQIRLYFLNRPLFVIIMVDIQSIKNAEALISAIALSSTWRQ